MPLHSPYNARKLEICLFREIYLLPFMQYLSFTITA